MAKAKQKDDPAAELMKRVAGLLNGCLGARPFPRRTVSPRQGRWTDGQPILFGVLVGLAYALLFCVLPFCILRYAFDRPPDPHLFWLQVYASLYIAWATTTARAASADVLRIIGRSIVPQLSPQAAKRIDDDLANGFEERRLSVVSSTVAVLGAVAAGYAISRDAHAGPAELVWWCLGWLFLFVTAARSTDVARFYSCFAKHLDGEPNIYALDPARSILVRGVAAVGWRILVFWFGILLAIPLLLPFVSLGTGWRDYGDTSFWLPNATFVWLVVPITSAFSIPFGTMVFLRSEKAIRTAVNTVYYATLRATEREGTDLFARRGALDEAQWKRLEVLEALHRHMTTAGSYRSVLASTASLLIPLIGPIVTLSKPLFEYLKQ